MSRRRGILRYTSDIKTIICTLLFQVLVYVNWNYNPIFSDSLNQFIPFVWLRYLIAGVLVMVICFSSFQCAVIVHNVIHVPLFYNQQLNNLYQYLLGCCYGHSVTSFVNGHNLSHHKVNILNI